MIFTQNSTCSDHGIFVEIYTVKKKGGGGYKLSVEFSQSNFSVIFTQNSSCSDQGTFKPVLRGHMWDDEEKVVL